MWADTKSEQLQIRITPEQKAAIKRLAQDAGVDVSNYVLQRVLPSASVQFSRILEDLRMGEDYRYTLAALNDLLTSLTGAQLVDPLRIAPPALRDLSPLLQNYVAAMIDHASYQDGVEPPGWTAEIRPLEEPYFTTALRSLRLYLLRATPVAFKRRNVFLDASTGARV